MNRAIVAAALLLSLPGVARAQDPSMGGNRVVVTEQLDGLHRPDGSSSRLEVVLPVDVSRAWPVVLFIHGWSAEPWYYDGLVHNLASRGYAVAKLDQIDILDLDLQHWIAAGETAIDALEAASADPSSSLYGLLDMSSLAVVGHSYGGATTLCLAGTDPRIKTAVALTPGVAESARPLLMRLAARVTIPTLVLGSELDPVVPAARFALPAYLQLATSEKEYVELARGEHLNFTDFGVAYWLWLPLSHGGWVKTMDAGEMRTLSRRYTNAWVDDHLGVRPDTQGFVDGRQAAVDKAAGLLSRFDR